MLNTRLLWMRKYATAMVTGEDSPSFKDFVGEKPRTAEGSLDPTNVCLYLQRFKGVMAAAAAVIRRGEGK